MSHSAMAQVEAIRLRADVADPLVALLGVDRSVTDAEALSLLRRRFPETALCERVAAITRWRRG